MRVIDVENINRSMRNETEFVLHCEEVFHDKVGAAAATILARRPLYPVVALTGPSGRGKTTTAMRLKSYLENLGVPVILLSMDNFFLNTADRPPQAQKDWESPYCVNVELLTSCITRFQSNRCSYSSVERCTSMPSSSLMLSMKTSVNFSFQKVLIGLSSVSSSLTQCSILYGTIASIGRSKP